MDIECNKKNNKENIKYSLVTVFGLFIVLLTQTSHIKMCLCTLKIQ